MAEAQLSESKDRPKGQLKVTTTVALGSTWLTPRMGEFLDVYPDVTVDLLLDDRELDLSMREADVAIRMAPPRQPELIQRHLMTVHMNIYAAPRLYQALRPAEDGGGARQPQGRSSTARRRARRCPTPTADAPGRQGRRAPAPRPSPSTMSMPSSARREAGLGLAALPEFMVQGTSNLVRVLPEVEGPRIDAYFVYPEELRNSKRIQVFRDFLLRKVAETER